MQSIKAIVNNKEVWFKTVPREEKYYSFTANQAHSDNHLLIANVTHLKSLDYLRSLECEKEVIITIGNLTWTTIQVSMIENRFEATLISTVIN